MKSDYIVMKRIEAGTLKADPNTGGIFTMCLPGYSGEWVKLKGAIGGRGYVTHGITYNKESRDIYAHRIVWLACDGPIPDGMVVHHKDHDRTNNKRSNLALIPHYENSAGPIPITTWISNFMELYDIEMSHK